MNADTSPPIRSLCVTLRYFVPKDASKVFAMSQESALRTWLPNQVYASEADALQVLHYLIEKCRDPGTPSLAPYVLGVSLNETGELVGHVGLSPLNGQIEIGYAIEDRYRGRGFASEAVRAMLDWALPRFSLSRVLGIVASDNTASCKVLQRAGFELETELMGSLHGRSTLVRTYQRVR